LAARRSIVAQLLDTITGTVRTVASAFARFDQELLLDPNERAAAEKMHQEITAEMLSARVIVDFFLQGSFARKTMIAPLRDIDKVVILAPGWANLQTTAGGPDKAMDLIQNVIATKWPAATFDRTRHSLKVDFGENNFSFDLVPAFETTTDDNDVEIADRKTGGWRRSNTRRLIAVVQERNEECGGRFIHQARMVKSFVRNLLGDEFPGLHAEAIAYVAITTTMADADAVAAVLSTAVVALRDGYYDPTGVDRLSDRLDPNLRQRAKAAFLRASEGAQEALRLQWAGDQLAAIRLWSTILGAPFPDVAPQSVDQTFRIAAAGGSITTAGTASSTSAGRQESRPTRSWGL
jgi:Second Messenger Oligonucleotide or Dinucleotide Synthetase domain